MLILILSKSLFVSYLLNCSYRANQKTYNGECALGEYIRLFGHKMHGRRNFLKIDIEQAIIQIFMNYKSLNSFSCHPTWHRKIQLSDVVIIRTFNMYYHNRCYRRILERYEVGHIDPTKINVFWFYQFCDPYRIHKQQILKVFNYFRELFRKIYYRKGNLLQVIIHYNTSSSE